MVNLHQSFPYFKSANSAVNRGFAAAMSAWPALLISIVQTSTSFHWWGPYWPHHHQWNPCWKDPVPKCAWLCRKLTWNQSSKFPSQHLRRYILEMHHSTIQAVHLATGKQSNAQDKCFFLEGWDIQTLVFFLYFSFRVIYIQNSYCSFEVPYGWTWFCTFVLMNIEDQNLPTERKKKGREK